MDDRISSLPDHILSHILSFLLTEDVYATSFLSKRWIPLRLLVKNLDIDDQRYVTSGKSLSAFKQMIHATLFALTTEHKFIQKIHIKCDYANSHGLEYSLLKNSLTAAAEHGMEHLDLSLMKYNPCFISSFRTLVVLKLKELSFQHFSNAVELASLKILHVFRVNIKRCDYLAKLLDGCPILEDFEIKDLISTCWSCNQEFKKLSRLVRANIIQRHGCHDIPPLHTLCNVEFLRLETILIHVSGDKIPIFVNLTHFELFYDGLVDFDWDMINGLLENCPNLQNFLIDKTQCDISDEELRRDPFVPKCISLQLRKCTITNFNRYDLEFVKYIMQQNSACLRSMMLYIQPSIDEDPFDKLEILNGLLSSVEISPTCKFIFI
ncbi:unnamed protein product [Trifolium pratense]|uniref:Uncharacterized protein n=1 Tax=Trifolium pratense TaxID=57577 RepID=A0ACB0LPG3_TRIPR|nr:unnamed protein product [Trifolium pratense]